MKKYTAVEIENFLMAIDSFLIKKVEIIVIGGTAAALAYKVSKATQDVDTWNSIHGLSRAYEKAKEQTKLNIPMGQVSVGDAPYDFEDRLVVYKPKIFKKLIILIPEVIDLILMKVLRGYEHDLEAIEEMIKNEKVKVNDLVNRYLTEMNSVIGDKRKIDLNFLAAVERCYGEKSAIKAKEKLATGS